MKVFLKQRYEEEVFESVLVKATTRFEKMALKMLKNDLLVGDYGEFHPEFPGWRYFNSTPSGIETLEAAYKMAGRYRKLARFRKEVERIEKIRMARHERVYNELSEQRRVAWEKEQEAV